MKSAGILWYNPRNEVAEKQVITRLCRQYPSRHGEPCSVLTSVSISNSVTSIDDYAFYGCSSLTSTTIPDSVTSIGNFAFYGCNSLTSVTIPNSVTSIGSLAFGECGSLTSVAIPDSVISIDAYAFFGCSSLTSVKIPNGITSINGTFQSCSSLTNVTIPVSVTSIGSYAFDKCTSLTDVYYGGSEAEWNAIEIGSYNDYLTSATVHYNSTGPDDTGDTEDTDLMRGDINGDGVIDAADLTLLARYVGKIISSFD